MYKGLTIYDVRKISLIAGLKFNCSDDCPSLFLVKDSSEEAKIGNNTIWGTSSVCISPYPSLSPRRSNAILFSDDLVALRIAL